TGVNIAARALELRPGDEVLATDLEYDACDLTWAHVCERAAAHYVRAEVDRLCETRSERTRAVFIAHVTSETALLLPVGAVAALARCLVPSRWLPRGRWSRWAASGVPPAALRSRNACPTGTGSRCRRWARATACCASRSRSTATGTTSTGCSRCYPKSSRSDK